AALGGRVLAVHLDGADVPALAVGVHLEGDGGARRERDREVLLRTGCRVVTPGFTRLVRVHDVVADPEVVLVGAGAATPRSGFHFRPRGGSWPRPHRTPGRQSARPAPIPRRAG